MKINSERRNFFRKFGIGAVASTIMAEGFSAVKLFASPNNNKKKTEEQISITINPMAVKRTRKR
jgi:hypothetical protein